MLLAHDLFDSACLRFVVLRRDVVRRGRRGHRGRTRRSAHFCVGAALARLEARVVISQLLAASSVIQPAGNAERLPSPLVRRLPLTVR